MARRGRQQGFVYKMFLTEWKNKSTALVLALVIWGITFWASLSEEEHTVQVEIVAAKSSECILELTVVEDAKTEVRKAFNDTVVVTLRGTAQSLSKLRDEVRVGKFTVDPDGRVDLQDKNAYNFPNGLEVIATNPVRIEATTDNLVTRSVSVQVQTVGGECRASIRFRGDGL